MILIAEAPVRVAKIAEGECSAKGPEVGEEGMDAQANEKEGEAEVECGGGEANQSKS